MIQSKKGEHKTDFTSLKKLSDQVFDLEKQYKLILQSIAVRKIPPNLKDIEKFVAKSEFHYLSRTSVRRRINGSSALIGFVPLEYVEGISSDQPHYRNEKDYYLTLKGMIAALSVGITIDRIYSFNCYFDFLSKIIKDKKIYDIAKQCIKNQIQYFLSWHVVIGLQLQKLVQSFIYIQNFFDSDWETEITRISWSRLSNYNSNELKKVIEKHAILEKSLDKLQKGNLFSKVLVKPENMFSGKIKYDGSNKMSVYYIVKYWYWFIEKLQIDYWQKSQIDVLIANPVYLSDIKVSDIVEEIVIHSEFKSGAITKLDYI